MKEINSITMSICNMKYDCEFIEDNKSAASLL